MDITQAHIKDHFDYTEDGFLLRKKTGLKVGHLFLDRNKKEYYRVTFNKKNYMAHRLIYIFHHGAIEKPEIDHIDGNGLNNKIENLRQATKLQNLKNQKIRVTNTSGVKGVTLDKKWNKWRARIMINGKEKTVGFFDNLFSAAIARKEAEQKYYGEFARKE